MKILYDYQAFDMQQFGGISNCFVKLIENLPEGLDYEIAVKETDNLHLANSSLKVEYGHRQLYEDIFISKHKFKGRGFLYRATSKVMPWMTSLGKNRKQSIDALKRGDYDVFHPTFFHPYFLKYLNGKPFVLTIHDMIPELFWGKRDAQAKWKPVLCEKAAHIIAVSEQTKSDLIRLLQVPEDKVTVIYHGAPKANTIKETEKPLVEGKYLLYVGQRNLYKSFKEMVCQLAPVMRHHKDLKIICTGKDFSKSERMMLHNLGLDNYVLHMHPSDQELINLYANALCFIYPSVYEGFGIPILEAYRAGCPVLLNNKSCFPEIAQEAAIYFHLDDKGSNLADVMEQFLNMPIEERDNLIKKQNTRLQAFSWEASAQKLAEVYYHVCHT